MEFKIKANDILTFRNGVMAIVYEFEDELLYAVDSGWSNIKNFNYDLTAFRDVENKEQDIMKIQRPEKEYHPIPKYWDKAPVVWERSSKKLFYGMTFEEAHRKMWTWLAENPDKMEIDWFIENDYEENIINLCFACECCNNKCEKCPLDKNIIGCDKGLYDRYTLEKCMENYELASKYAKIISELLWDNN